jgi:hypothetical protein
MSKAVNCMIINKTNPLASLHSMQAAEARTIVVGIRIYSIYEILE